MQGITRKSFRRTARVGAVAIAATTLTFALTAPGQAAPTQETAGFGPGTGSAIALAYKVNPLFGNLSFGITAGESVAGHQNTGASAQSKAVNLGVIGVTLAGEGCKGDEPTLPAEDQPQPVIVTTDDPNSASGKTAEVLGIPNLIRMSARATKAPFAQAITTVAPIGDPAGVAISGGTATATSGVVNAGTREAKAVSEIGEISFFNGLLTLRGLRWEAIQRSGGTTTNSGSFTLGSLHLAGNVIPLPDDALQQITVLRDVLGALGLTLTPPQTRVEQGIVFVDPLRIGIVPSVARDALISGVLGVLAPVRQAFTDLLAELGCEGQDIIGNNGKTAITVLDLALASISGAGALTLEVGGVQATTSELGGFSGLGLIPALPDLPAFDSGLGSLPVGSDLPDLGSGSAGPGSNTGGSATPKPISDDDDGERGGVLLGVGAGGLLLMLLTAEADRRKMRRAQREIPLEA
jgi:hypothetical protein